MTETGYCQWWSKRIPKVLFHVAHIVDIVVSFDAEVVFAVIFAVIAPDDLAVCFDALALCGGHRHSGTGLLDKFDMICKSMSAEGFLCKCGFEQTLEILWMEVAGSIEDETPDQLRITIVSGAWRS